MEILNTVCFVCATVLSAVVLIIMFVSFIACIVFCFTEKKKANTLVNIIIAIVLGCACPLFLKLALFFAFKI